MAAEAIKHEYYAWLVSQIHIPNKRSYEYLFERMHNLEFVWTVPNDDNRIQDGRDLRYEFSETYRRDLKLEWVSILEVLVALSRRVAFLDSVDPTIWAWKLLKNLKLTKMSDPVSPEKVEKIEEILYALVWRTYERNGEGGFFPLRHHVEDQTKTEIWFQMNAYVMEMDTP